MLQTWATTILLLLSIYERQANAINIPFVPPPAAVLKAEGITPQNRTLGAVVLLAAPPSGNAISRAGWTVTCDSFQPGNECNLVLDGDPNTFWHTAYDPVDVPQPHQITIDMQASYNVNGLQYQGRQDGAPWHGNFGQHNIFLSADGTDFGSPVAFGTWLNDATTKTAAFETKPARYVRIQSLTDAGGNGDWASMAEINVFAAASYTPPALGLGSWGPTIDLPLVPVAAAVEPTTGKVLTWSSNTPSSFGAEDPGVTVTATYDPIALTVSQRTVTETGHDMFCPGISFDFNGRVIVTGGSTSAKTSIYDPPTDAWIPAANMQLARGYQASATCSDGRIFTIGGSWSGGQGGKNGEIYDPTANTWTLLPGCPVAPMLTADAALVYRADNHGWLFGWRDRYVFQAGPSHAMNWYNTDAAGDSTPAGNRAADGDAMCGNAVMYDAVAGKILTLGGAPNYDGSTATSNAHIITLGAPGAAPEVTAINTMWFIRTFANAVVLPNGQVFVTGGQEVGKPFTDDAPDLTPEIWDPASTQFVKLLPNSTPRTYHSIALLLLDGTVLSGGGGLCDTCSTNHFDAQVYTPQYLLNADGTPAARPVINTVSAASIAIGGTLTVETDSEVASMALIRYGTATHTADTDQRRIPLTPTAVGTNTYTVDVPGDAGIALPGYWMLFALNAGGVPSVAKTVQITLA